MKKIALTMILAAFVAAPAQASIIYNNFSTPETSTFGTGAIPDQTILTLSLPGSANLDILRFTDNGENFFQFSSTGGAEVNNTTMINGYYYANSLPVGTNWGDLPGSTNLGWGNITSLNSAGGTVSLRSNPTYIPFKFQDTTDSNATKYGYVNLSTETSGSGASTNLTLNVYGYGYENTPDTYITMGDMGAVPEPGTMTLLAFGGLALLHRRKRKTV